MKTQRNRLTVSPSDKNHSMEPAHSDIPEWLEEVRITVEQEAPIMQALIRRAVSAVLSFSRLSEDSVVNAASAPTDLTVLVRALSSGEFFEDLRQAVEKRRSQGKLVALTTGRHGYRYPVWQFDESGTIPGLQETLSVLAPF